MPLMVTRLVELEGKPAPSTRLDHGSSPDREVISPRENLYITGLCNEPG
jgi:hypothetical protein